MNSRCLERDGVEMDVEDELDVDSSEDSVGNKTKKSRAAPKPNRAMTVYTREGVSRA